MAGCGVAESVSGPSELEWLAPPAADGPSFVAADCKNTLMAILGSVEKLLKDGFKPER